MSVLYPMTQTGSAKRNSFIASCGWCASKPASNSTNSLLNRTVLTAPYWLANPAERKFERVSGPAAAQQVAAIQHDHNNVRFIAIFDSSSGFRLFLCQLPPEAHLLL